MDFNFSESFSFCHFKLQQSWSIECRFDAKCQIKMSKNVGFQDLLDFITDGYEDLAT